MRYGKVADNKLYSDFLKKVKKSKETYENLLVDMKSFSEIYCCALTPNISDYGNKKEYYFLIRCLNSINEIYGIVQVRPVIMSLLYIHNEEKIMSYKEFKKIIVGLTNFHLAYNAICSKRTSSLENPLNTFAHSLYECKDKTGIEKTCNELKKGLLLLLPKEEEFVESLKKLKYSKKNTIN